MYSVRQADALARLYEIRYARPEFVRDRSKCKAATRSAFGDRTARIAAPFTPGTGIQRRAVQSGQFHGEKIVTSRDARSAIVHDLVAGSLPQQRGKFLTQLARRLEAPIRLHIFRNRPVQRPVDVPGDRINRLVLAQIALARPRVDNAPRAR